MTDWEPTVCLWIGRAFFWGCGLAGSLFFIAWIIAALCDEAYRRIDASAEFIQWLIERMDWKKKEREKKERERNP
jgi:hypothetical protein